MFGELNPEKIALESFNSFKKALDVSVDVAPQNRAILDDLNKKQALAQKEQQIKQEVSQLSGRGAEASFAFGKPMEYTPEKLSWTARNYDVGDLYTELSDGTLYKNFETYTPGINNYEDKARSQTTGERWVNLGAKFLNTLGTGVVGGTVGTIYSIPTAIKEGKLSALYDNDFMQSLDLYQEKSAINYKQFIQQEDKEDFFNWQLADDVSQGLAFTGGALLTDALWAYATGGTSLSTTGARWAMKLGKIADKTVDATKYLDDALKVAKVGKAEAVIKPFMATNRTLQKYGRIGGALGETANLTRSLFTGAGYEAGFEARAYMNEARRDFKKQFKAQNGVDPTEEELKEFENNLASTANGLYAYNLAIVGASNLAQFGSLMKLKLPDFGVSKTLNKRLFGVGTEIIENAPKALVATSKQKIAQTAWSLSKGALIEGAWEEGMQSVGNNTAMNLIKQTYDPKIAKENYGLVEATMKGFAETYGTKEGLHEIAVGMLVGAITGNALGIYNNKTLAHEFKNANERNKLIEETFGKESTYTANTAIENMLMANRVAVSKKAEQQAERKGDLLGGQLARGGALYAQFQRGKALDFLDEQTEMLSNSIDLIDSVELAKEQGISLEQANNLKESMKVELAKEKERFDRISQFTDVFISNNQRESDFQEFFEQYKKKNEGIDERVLKKQFTSVMKEALNYELYLGELSYEHADEMLGTFKNELQTLLGSDKIRKSVDIHDIVNKSKKSTQRELNNNKKELEKTNNELNNIESRIRNLENVVNKATTPEQRQASLSSLNDLTVRRTELSEKVISLTRDFNVLKNSAKLESKFGERATNEDLSTEEILSLEKDINKTLETIQQLKESDLEKANRLEKLLREYEKSVIAYKKYSERTNQMMNVGQGLGGKRGILAKMVLDSNPNQATKEMIKGLLDTHYEKSETQNENLNEAIQNIKLKEQESQEEGISMNPVDNVQEVKSFNLIEYIKQTIKDNPYLFEQVGDNVEDTLPSDEELIEYIELYSPVLDNPAFNSSEFTYNLNEQLDLFKKYLSPEEIDRLKELNTKFANWQLIESIGSEGISLADLIQQEALSRQEVRKVQKEADVNETVLETASKEVDENGERRFDILQTIENVFIVDNKARTHKLVSHMTPKKFFELIGEVGQLEVVHYNSEGKQIEKPVKTTVENINSVVKPNSKIHFGNSFIEITRGMRIKYRNDLNISLNTRPTKSGYSLVFDSEGNAMLSDFQDVDTYSPQEIFALKAGDELELRVEDNDFNLSLNEDDFLDNLQVSIYKDGTKVGDLKANYGEGEKSEFLKIRQKAKNIFTDTDTQTVGFIRANNVFLGTPNLKLGENGTEQLFDVVEEAVKDYGYWDGSKLDLKNNSKPRTDLLKDIKTNTPVIVVEENGMPVAYPAVLKAEDKNLGTEIMNKGLNKGQLVLELNKALKENGIDTNLYYISYDNTNMFELDGKTSALLEDYIAKLDRVQDKADFKDDLSKVQVNIDLSGNRFFLSPKLAIDLNSFKEVSNVQTQETVSEDVLKLHNYKNELLKLSNKNQSQSFNKQAVKIDDTTLRMEGVTKKFIQIGDNIYVYSESNKSHAKWVRDYNSGIEQALDLIQSKLTKYKEADIFRDYNKIQAEVDKLERDFLTKAEYEDYLGQLKRKEDSEQGKKC